MKLLIVNFAMDPMDPVLGFAVPWAQAVANYFDDAHVLTGRRSPSLRLDCLGVTDVGWTPGRTPANVARLAWKFNRVLTQFRPSVVFVHMAASYAAVVGPICRARSIPLVLWYEHQSTSRELRLAERWASVVVSASGSYPGTREPIVVGHGIVVGDFGPRPRRSREPGAALTAAVHAGRADPIKRLELIAQEIGSLRTDSGRDYSFTQIGDQSRGGSEYTQSWNVADWVHSLPTMSRVDLAQTLPTYDFFVHAYGGAIDKAPLEASIAGLPVLSEGAPVYRALGGVGPAPSLSQQMERLSRMTTEEVDSLVAQQQESVLRNHSLESTAHRIADILKAQVRS